MYHTEAGIVINRPLADVFTIVSDMRQHQKWQEGLVEASWTSDGSPGVGSTYRFVSQFAGMRWDLPGEVTLWNPPNGWRWKASGGPFPVKGGFRLEQVGSGTRITMFSDSEPQGWMNTMRAILKWMGERTYRRSLTRLKAIIESQ